MKKLPILLTIIVLIIIIAIIIFTSFRLSSINNSTENTLNTAVNSEVGSIATTSSSSTGVNNIPASQDGNKCYKYHQVAIASAPYAVDEYININISGTKVTGTKTGNQKGPDMSNGYTGTLEGYLDKDIITVIFSYIVEGSKGKEKELYKIVPEGLLKLHYPLREEKGILVPDTTKSFNMLSYLTTDCPIAANGNDRLLSESEARTIAEKTCVKGGEVLGVGIYNENSKTWWYDANLNSVREGCNPACVVDEKTKTAEINWRCTGVILK